MKSAAAPELTVRTVNFFRRRRGSNARMMAFPADIPRFRYACGPANTLTDSLAVGADTVTTTA